MFSPCLKVAHGRLLSLILLGALGCVGKGPEDLSPVIPDPKTFVPVSGVVTLDGKPLASAVVTFLPTGRGLPANGETGEDGKYEIKTMEQPGAPPGEYKVAVSLLVSADGKPQGLGPRSSIVQSAGMLSAKEQLAPTCADLGRTKLHAIVEAKGGTFDFQVERTPAASATSAPDQAKPTTGAPGKPAGGPAARPSTPAPPAAEAKPK